MGLAGRVSLPDCFIVVGLRFIGCSLLVPIGYVSSLVLKLQFRMVVVLNEDFLISFTVAAFINCYLLEDDWSFMSMISFLRILFCGYLVMTVMEIL